MTTKDWKQDSKSDIHIQWEKGNYPKTFIHIYKKDINWNIAVNKSGKTVLEKSFKTKHQALKYAKAYIRKH